MSPSELMGERLLKLVNKPDAARLQATVIAMACMGVYSPPFGKAIDGDLLILTTAAIEARGCFPLRTIEDCVSAFDAALVAHTANAQAHFSEVSDSERGIK